MFVFKTVICGTVLIFVALIAGPWLAIQLDSSFPAVSLGWARYLGVPLIAVGLPLAVYCTAVLFLPGANRPAPYDAGGVFTIAGPYRYVRNPFLLSVVVTLWGETVLMERIAMFAYAVLFSWCIHFWVVFFEEPALAERFGEEYTDYKKAVPRWLPKLRKYER